MKGIDRKKERKDMVISLKEVKRQSRSQMIPENVLHNNTFG